MAYTFTKLFKRIYKNDTVINDIDDQINDYARSNNLGIVQVSIVSHAMSTQITALVLFTKK